MRFRQVHLDFHTSEAIPGIAKNFSKQQFQDTLRRGHVNSITVFSKCHHGWAYHPSTANEMHPYLDYDLLGAMIEAAHEIGVKTPVYISAGLDEKMARRHPEWLVRRENEETTWAKSFMEPGYHLFCYNTPYLDYLMEQVKEVVENYDADGIFLDISSTVPCYCQSCVATIRQHGGDPRDTEAMTKLWEETYANYARRANETVYTVKPGLPVFHNGGHIRRGRRDLVELQSHLELESLPTGGWGYDHFPLSARYAQQLGKAYLGMTGKFHTSWGEFGGFKHPNALRFETALSLANGARCSIGDQLHPEGWMDEATYELIGHAYREVEAKEAWCTDTSNVADIAILSAEAYSSVYGGTIHTRDTAADADAGAVRILQEGHYLYDVVDLESDLSGYKVVILPDRIRVNQELKQKLDAFTAGGGKILATGESGLGMDEPAGFALDFGVHWLGKSTCSPSYFRPAFELKSLAPSAYVFYAEGQCVSLTGTGAELGSREESYFNQDIFTFCSHQHTPNKPGNAGVGMAEGPQGIYVAWCVFEDYANKGSLTVKQSLLHALEVLLPDKSLSTNLSAQGIVTVQEQPNERRWINHLLYASPVKRGKGIEVIEDLPEIRGTTVTLRVPFAVKSVSLEPQGREIPFTSGDDAITYTVPDWECHQMVVIQF